MADRSKWILTHVAIITTAFAVGTCAGVLLYPAMVGGRVSDHGPSAMEAEAHGDHEAHLDLSPTAIANLGLEMGKVVISDYTESQTFPGEVVEIPGQSDLSVAAPVSGVIEHVSIRDGQAVGVGEPLFELRITDQALTNSQANLLRVLSQLDVVNAEIQRLQPLVAQGAVKKTRTLELEYEARTLEAQRQTIMQEILARGLPQSTLDHVLETRKLARRILIDVPDYQTEASPNATDFTRQVSVFGSDRSYSIAQIHAHPGLMVQAGFDLCDLSYHGRLYIKGQAFENDLPIISQLSKSGTTVTAEFGHQHQGGHLHSVLRDNLRVTHVDNHVDATTQTFAFFLPLENDLLHESTTENRLYRQWRFRPGQRVHLRVPMAKHRAEIKLPIEAVGFEAHNAVVFRRIKAADDGHHHDHDEHAHGHDHEHDHADQETAGMELEPVPVHVLYRDHDVALIGRGGDLKVGDEVAMNCAHKLLLAMKMNAGAGGGHHDHEH